MAPVNLVTIHHEGAGTPTEDVQRFSEGGYCYGLGITTWTRFRAPVDNWATLGFNGLDLTTCFSGDRTNIPVTDSDLALLHSAFMDCYGRGEVTATPVVRAHRNSPGSSTVCPGDQTMLRWPDIVAACTYKPPPPPEPPVNTVQLRAETNLDGRGELFALNADGTVTHCWRAAGTGDWGPWTSFPAVPLVSIELMKNDDGHLELFGYPPAGGVIHCWQLEPNGGTGWSAWKSLQ